ncbi:hypothetical protein B0J12DRAFT_731329 [Macrophomina phaseolina]|uniref:Uncharacterized protein n=1 Tax=Macrophomina phaseolina TaxID=35725 RepID=A0ABQ8G036_9PEZI|nr:hypothetical protein B0J12DRAFT_731329 [Macrophomina phaseolina]
MTPPKSASNRKRCSPAAEGLTNSLGFRKPGYRTIKRARPVRLSLSKQASNFNFQDNNAQRTLTENPILDPNYSATLKDAQCNSQCCCITTNDISAWLEGLPIDCTDGSQSLAMGNYYHYPFCSTTSQLNLSVPTYTNQSFCQAPVFSHGSVTNCSPSPPPAFQRVFGDEIAPAPIQNTMIEPCDKTLCIPQAQIRQTTGPSSLPTPVTPTFPTLPSQLLQPAPWESEPWCFDACSINIEQEALELSLKMLQQWHPAVMQTQRPDLLQQLWDTENSMSKFAAMLFELRMQRWESR